MGRLSPILATACFSVAALLAGPPAFSQYSKQYRACSKDAATQNEMDVCASQEAARTDAELNRVYRRLLAKAAKEPGAVKKIEAMEYAWTVYRDAYTRAKYPAKDKHAEYGSMYSMEADLLRAKLTRQQIHALKDIAQDYR